MEGDLSEKPPRASPPTSSHGESTDDTGLKGKHKSEGHKSESPAENVAELQKLDSKVIKVNDSEDDPFKHLPPDEAAILKRQVDVPVVPTSFKRLYRYATTNDMIIVAISVICSIAGGAALPLMTVWQFVLGISRHHC
jgi:ATP-binding cassette, subfamily B (MDR/TAP), member 1